MPLRLAPGFGERTFIASLCEWFVREPGSLVATIERRLLAGVLPDLFGYHIVQLGCHHVADLIETSRISHQLRVALGREDTAAAQLSCAEDALPLSGASVDVLVLPHVLEFVDDPHRVLREAERVLIGEGHIVVLGFNPWSFYGLWSLLLRWQGNAPWAGRFIGAARVKDWLQLLGFDIIGCARASFLPPSRRAGFNRRLEFVERLGAFAWPILGNVYLIVARKRVEGVTPLKALWRERRQPMGSSVVEPSTRVRVPDVGERAP